MPVQTRSQTAKKLCPSFLYADADAKLFPRKELFEVNINFDEASAAWRSNKRRVGESWVYRKPR